MLKRNHIRRSLLGAALTLAAVGVAAPAATATKVANPGTVAFTAVSGTLKIASLDPQDVTPGPGDPAITITGTVASNGTVNIPQSNIVFPDLAFDDPTAGHVVVHIIPTAAGTGSLNPLSGAADLQVKFYIKIDNALVGNNCTIGLPANPIVLNLTTGTSGSQTGVPYNPATALVTEVDGTFAVPAATNCGLGTSTINSSLALPSPSGNNFLVLQTSVSPVIQPGVVARFVASPSTGPAPLGVGFNASTSTVIHGPAQYRWDYDNSGGSPDFTTTNPADPAANHTYLVPGTYTARLTVVDADGDSSTVTHQIMVTVPHPDVSITKLVGADPFLTGVSEPYNIGVTNNGSLATTGPTTVTDVLPAGLTYNGASGSGWTCNEALGIVTCSYAASLAIGESAPTLEIDVIPTEAALGFVTNTATVSTFDDINPSNDSSSATVQVIANGVDLVMDKSHDATDGLLRGQRATYELTVSNAGTVDSDPAQRTRIEDTLPSDVTFVSASGPGWTCSTASLPTVKCFTDDVIAAGSAAPTVRIRVEVNTNAPGILSNTASVTNAGDTTLSNNSDTDVGSVSGYGADFQITKTHSGDFVLGQTGTYTIKVKNVGTKTAGSVVTVDDELPAGLVPISASGAVDPDSIDWSCAIVAQHVTCTYPGPVEAGNEPEAITINVAVNDEAVGTATNIATVTSPDDFNGANDSASDDTIVRSPLPDLAIDKSHAAAVFTSGGTGVYSLAVTNAANEPTRGVTTVTDPLPAGLTYVSATGSGWTCGAVVQLVTCTRSTPIQGLTTTTITLTVNVTPAAVPSVTNTATVSAANDTNAANNSDSDPAAVKNPPKPTTITADGSVATINVLQVRIGLDGMRAVLKSGTTPVAGKRLYFTTANGTPLCNGVTLATGEVRCGTVLVTMLQAALGTNYRVYFQGDDDYMPSSSTGPIVLLTTIRLF